MCMQHITYKEYLPKLMGEYMSKRIGKYNGYDPSVNPGVANEFMTSAFRMGHGMLQVRQAPDTYLCARTAGILSTTRSALQFVAPRHTAL